MKKVYSAPLTEHSNLYQGSTILVGSLKTNPDKGLPPSQGRAPMRIVKPAR